MAADNGNRVVQGLWIGDRLSALERLCILSFCAHGHEFHLYHYDELQNVPRIDGLRLIDAREILPRSAMFEQRNRSIVYFSDQFRYELLRQRGGWWVDMDTVCVRPFDIAAEVAIPSTPNPTSVLISPLKFPRGHFLTEAIVNTYDDINRIQPWDNQRIAFKKIRRRVKFWRNSKRHIMGWHAGGMEGLMSAVKHFGLEEYLLPQSVIFLPGDPQGHDAVKSAGYDFDLLLSANPDLRCVHLSNSHFKNVGVDKDGDYPADSLYEVLKRRFPGAG